MDFIEVIVAKPGGCYEGVYFHRFDLSCGVGYNLATSLLRAYPDVDGLYMPCNKGRTVSVIERIEKNEGKPVVTNTQTWTWEAMRAMGMHDSISGYGRLLSERSHL
jgi:maleate cis-trans isomerase